MADIPGADPLAPFRDAALATARNLGFAIDPRKLAPEHWQRVLAAVETRMRMRGVPLPEGWREELAAQIGRAGATTDIGPKR